APPIEDYNWCQHLLEIFDEAKIGKKGYTKADVNLMLIDDIGGFQNCYIIDWDKLAEAEDVIWFESKELRARRKKPSMELSTRPAKKGLLALGPATKCLPAEKSTVGVSKAVSSVGANKGPLAVGGFGAAGLNPFHFPFTRFAVDHLSSDELIGIESGGIESGGFKAPDEGVNVGSFSDVVDIGLDALLSAPDNDFVKEGFEVYTSQVGSLDPAEDRMETTFLEDNPTDAVGVESTLKEVGEGEHVTSGGSMEVDTDAVVVDNIGAVEVPLGRDVRPGSKRIKYTHVSNVLPFKLCRKKVIVKNSRLKIQVEAMRMQELTAKEKELEGKEQDNEIVAEQMQKEMEGLDEGIPIEFPGPCTQEFVTRIEALEVFANDIYKDEALSLALLRYIWSEDLPSEEILYELEDNDCRLSRDDFLGCAPGGEVSNFFVNSFSDMLLRSVTTAKASMQRWIFSPNVATLCNSPSEDTIGYAMDHLQGKGLPAVTWTNCDYVEDWMKENWMLPDNVNYRRSETCLQLLLSTTNSLKNDVCTKALKAVPAEEEDSEDDKEGTEQVV
ncbi:hypothetical protein LINGRAHAP2_LOCUS22859, partial [Linum grandiflorum]